MVTPTHLSDESAVIAIGKALGQSLRPGSVLALVGDLGAGKTHLTKGILQGLGSDANVTSPTFSLVHEYPTESCPAFHFDFYRLESEEDVLELGWDEYLDVQGVIIVEWADKFLNLFPSHTQWWQLSHAPGGGRNLVRI